MKFDELYKQILPENTDNLNKNRKKESVASIISQHINTYSVKDDPFDVATEIGKKYNWNPKQIEQAEQIIRKKYIK